jgi:hypothetical protein
LPEEVWVSLWKRFFMGLSLAAAGMVLIGIAAYRLSRSKEQAPGNAVQWLLSAVLLTGLAGSAAALHVGTPDSRARMPLKELRASTPVPRIVNPVHDIALPDAEGFDDFDILQAVMSRSGAAPFTIPSGVDNFTTYTGLVPNRFNNLVGSLNAMGDAKWIAFRRYALSHVVLTPPLSQPDDLAAKAATSSGQLVSSDPKWNISVWEVPHQPWARFAEQVLSVSTEADAIAAVVRLESAKDQTTVLQGRRPSMLAPGTVLSLERRPNAVRIEAEAAGDALLVVADAFWDGWKAFLDGKQTDIEIADGLVRAVRWPAGRHILEMRYDPVEVRIGAVISGITALLLLASVMRDRYLRYRTG